MSINFSWLVDQLKKDFLNSGHCTEILLIKIFNTGEVNLHVDNPHLYVPFFVISLQIYSLFRFSSIFYHNQIFYDMKILNVVKMWKKVNDFCRKLWQPVFFILFDVVIQYPHIFLAMLYFVLPNHCIWLRRTVISQIESLYVEKLGPLHICRALV